MKKNHFRKGYACMALVAISLFFNSVYADVRQGVKSPSNELVTNHVQQQKRITGIVVDQSGQSVIGANVVEKGTTNGTITDVDGKFSLNVSNQATLDISYIGYLSKSIAIGNENNLHIVLVEDSKSLEEVVVVAYGAQKKVNLTGSVASVTADDIQNRTYTTVQQAIQGQIPGLTVTQTGGQPGNEALNMSVRGKSTFSTNDPLVIVDGQAISMSNLNPQDIESVTVLKDAAAAAIYGARASGGVILVTTKRGKAGKISVSYDGYVGVQEATAYPQMVNAYDHARLFREAEYNDNPNTTTYTWSEEQVEEFRTGKKPSANRPDYLFDPAIQTQHNLSISGGSEKNTFLFSFGYLYQDGIMKNTSFNRLNFRISDQFKITDKLTADVMLNFMPTTRKAPSTATYPSGPTRNLGDIISSAYRRPSALPIFTEDGQWASVTAWANRFGLASEDGGFQNRKFNRINGSLSLNYNILEGLNIKGSYFGKYDPTREVNYSKRMQFISPEDCKTVDFDYSTNSMTVFNQSNYEHNLQALVTYDKIFGEDHDLKVLAGASMEWSKDYQETVGRRDFLTDDIYVINAGSADPNVWTTSGTASDWSIASYFGRINYAWKGRYLVEANIRYDGSSRFSSEVRWGVFPSFSAGWRISEEAFFSPLKESISNLKLRVSWGQVGNQNTKISSSDLGLYQHYSTISTSAYYFGGLSHTTAYYTNSVNDRLTWETKTTTNIGLDVTFLNDKMSLSVDGFKDRTSDILMRPVVPDTYGMGAPIMNVGTVDNIGWEAMISYRDRRNDFSWGINLQISDAKNKVKEMIGSPVIGSNQITEIDYEMNEWYGWKCEGIFSSEEEVKNHAFQNIKTGIGDLKYQDTDGNGTVNADDRVRLGSSRPRFPFGINLNVGWIGLDLSLFLQGVASQKTYINSYGGLPLHEQLGTLQEHFKDRWHQDDQGNWIAGKYPKLRIGGVNVGNFSSFWLQNSAYLRAKNMQLGYTLPANAVKKLSMQHVRFYLNAENLFTFTKMKGVDPESPTGNGSMYPLTKVYSLGINVSF